MSGDVLGATENLTVPLPIAEAPEVIVNHGTVTDADHAQFVPAVTVTVTEPLVEAAAVVPIVSWPVVVTSAPLCTSTVPELPAVAFTPSERRLNIPTALLLNVAFVTPPKAPQMLAPDADICEPAPSTVIV